MPDMQATAYRRIAGNMKSIVTAHNTIVVMRCVCVTNLVGRVKLAGAEHVTMQPPSKVVVCRRIMST